APLLLEQPLDRSRFTELPVVAGEGRADLRGRPVPAVGGGLDHDRHAARAVALVHDALDLYAVAAAGRTIDGALDVGDGHVHGASPIHGEAEPEVAFRIAATLASGEHDLSGHLGEDRATFHIVR